MSARALARAGLVGAFGHCSLRLDADHLLVCAPKPMGLISATDQGTVVNIHDPLPEGVLGEVRMHQSIYAMRADVKGICRTFPPQVLALAAMGLTPRARHGFGSYFYPKVPHWSDTGLIRDELSASQVAQTLGHQNAIVVSINGAVTVADSLEKATALSWFLEDAARVELAVMNAGHAHVQTFESEQAAKDRATWSGGILERMWLFMTRDDSELLSS